MPGLRGDASILNGEQKLVKARESVAAAPEGAPVLVSPFFGETGRENPVASFRNVSAFLDKQAEELNEPSLTARARTLAPTSSHHFSNAPYRCYLWAIRAPGESNTHMSEKPLKRYLFASDFDQTLTFDDSGYVLSELVGIPTAEFERKAQGMAKLNLVQQGAELSYLLLHDPEFRKKVRKQHLYEVGKNIRLKENIELLYQVLKTRSGWLSLRFLRNLRLPGGSDSVRSRGDRSP